MEGAESPVSAEDVGWDAYRIVHWAYLDSTSLANASLLCRRHHRAVIQGRSRASKRGNP